MAEEISLSGRTIAVTGAGGFIGAALCRRLASEGSSVIGVDIAGDAAGRVEETGASFRRADTTVPEEIGEALAGAELAVHTAAIVSESGSMADHVRVNVRGTANVLDAAEAAGTERLLHLSSVAVYGYEAPDDQDEEAPPRACGVPYIDTKSASDRLARRRGAIVLRPGDVYGPGSVPWAVRPLRMARMRTLGLPRGRRCRMLPVYIDDLAEAAVLALARGRPGRAYTAFDDREEVGFGDLFDRYAQLTGRGEAVPRLPRAAITAAGLAGEAFAGLAGREPFMSRHSATLVDRPGTAATGRAREELGWEPRVDFEEGLRRTEAWARQSGFA